MNSVGRGVCNNGGALTALDLFGQRCGPEAVSSFMQQVTYAKNLLSLNIGMSNPEDMGDQATGEAHSPH